MGGTHVTDGIAYRLRVSPRARRVRIVIHRDGVEVVVPHGASSADAARFVQRSRAWIERHLAQIGSASASSPPNPYADLPLFAAPQPGEMPARIETIHSRAARSRWSPAPSTGLAPDPPPHAKKGPCGPFLFHAMPDHSGLTSTRTRMRSPGW